MANFKRIIKVGWTNFQRNSWLSLGTTGIMTLTIFVLISLVAFNVLSASVIVSLQEKVDVTAYFKDESPEDQIFKIKEDLEGLPEVRSVEYISKESALEIFRERHSGDQLIQEALTELGENPLQAALNIRAIDPSQYSYIVGFIEKNKFRNVIEKINFYENSKAINRVESISSNLKKGGSVAALIFAAIAVFVAFNTVRLTIYSQRQEIEIMKLVGASNWHIRGPFIAEGAMYGIFAAALVLVIVYPLAYFLSPKILSFISSVNLFSYLSQFWWQIFILSFSSGIILGALSSVIAIRRYLKV